MGAKNLFLRLAALVDKASFGVFHREVDKSDKKVKDHKKSLEGVGKAWQSIKAAAIAYASVAALQKMGQAALDEMKILDRLKFKVEETGEQWRDASVIIDDHANSYKDLGFDSGTVVEVIDRMMGATDDLGQSLGLTDMAMKKAAQTGRPLEEIILKLQALYGGAAQEIRGYGKTVDAAARLQDNAKGTLQAWADSVREFNAVENQTVLTFERVQVATANAASTLGGPLVVAASEAMGMMGGDGLGGVLKTVAVVLVSGLGQGLLLAVYLFNQAVAAGKSFAVILGGLGAAAFEFAKGNWGLAADIATESFKEAGRIAQDSYNKNTANFKKSTAMLADASAAAMEAMASEGLDAAERIGLDFQEVAEHDIRLSEQMAKQREAIEAQMQARITQLAEGEFAYRRTLLDQNIQKWKEAGIAITLINQVAAAEREAILADEADAKAEKDREEIDRLIGLAEHKQNIELMLLSAKGMTLEEERLLLEDHYEELYELAAEDDELMQELKQEHATAMAEIEAEAIRQGYEAQKAMKIAFDAWMAGEDAKAIAKKLKREALTRAYIYRFSDAFAKAMVKNEGDMWKSMADASRSVIAAIIRETLTPMAIAKVMTGSIPFPANVAAAAAVGAGMLMLASAVEGGGGGGGAGVFEGAGGGANYYPEGGGGIGDGEVPEQEERPAAVVNVIAWDPYEAAYAVAGEMDDVYDMAIHTGDNIAEGEA